jgi:hypothetical protein
MSVATGGQLLHLKCLGVQLAHSRPYRTTIGRPNTHVLATFTRVSFSPKKG